MTRLLSQPGIIRSEVDIRGFLGRQSDVARSAVKADLVALGLNAREWVDVRYCTDIILGVGVKGHQRMHGLMHLGFLERTYEHDGAKTTSLYRARPFLTRWAMKEARIVV